jgi:hypothetical protein
MPSAFELLRLNLDLFFEPRVSDLEVFGRGDVFHAEQVVFEGVFEFVDGFL